MLHTQLITIPSDNVVSDGNNQADFSLSNPWRQRDLFLFYHHLCTAFNRRLEVYVDNTKESDVSLNRGSKRLFYYSNGSVETKRKPREQSSPAGRPGSCRHSGHSYSRSERTSALGTLAILASVQRGRRCLTCRVVVQHGESSDTESREAT